MATEAEAVAKLLKENSNHLPFTVVDNPNGQRVIVHRNDFEYHDITPPNAAKVEMPKIVTQRPILQTTASLKRYVSRFKDADTTLFADITKSRVVSVIDYHEAPVRIAEQDDGPSRARLCQHVATLQLPFSQEWGIWTGGNNGLVSHIGFADFLEENALDIVEPMTSGLAGSSDPNDYQLAGADLLELCRDLHVTQGMQFNSAVRHGDEVKLEFQKEDDVTTKDGMEIPIDFFIRIPVYFGEPSVIVRCMTRRKIDNGKLFLGYKMLRHENIRQTDFQRIVQDVVFDTGSTQYAYGVYNDT